MRQTLFWSSANRDMSSGCQGARRLLHGPSRHFVVALRAHRLRFGVCEQPSRNYALEDFAAPIAMINGNRFSREAVRWQVVCCTPWQNAPGTMQNTTFRMGYAGLPSFSKSVESEKTHWICRKTASCRGSLMTYKHLRQIVPILHEICSFRPNYGNRVFVYFSRFTGCMEEQFNPAFGRAVKELFLRERARCLFSVERLVNPSKLEVGFESP